MYTRIKQILDSSGLNQQEFAERIAIAPATLSNILKGKVAKYSTDLVMSIVAAYPAISLSWLMSGQGDMYNAAAPDADDDDNTANGLPTGATGEPSAFSAGRPSGSDGLPFAGFPEGAFSGDATFAYNSASIGNGPDTASGRKTILAGAPNSARSASALGAGRGSQSAMLVPGLAHANGSPITFEELGKIVSHFSGLNFPGNAAFQGMKIQDKQPRKIKEIRIFYDDDTFEVFSANKE